MVIFLHSQVTLDLRILNDKVLSEIYHRYEIVSEVIMKNLVHIWKCSMITEINLLIKILCSMGINQNIFIK